MSFGFQKGVQTVTESRFPLSVHHTPRNGEMMSVSERKTRIRIRICPEVEQQFIHRSRPDRIQIVIERTADAFRRIDRQASSATHQRDTVATGSLVHIRRRNHNRNPLPLQPVQHIPKLHTRNRIDTRRRLIQEKDIGSVDQRTAQRQLLLHPAGELPGFPFLERLYLDIDIPDQVVVFPDSRIEHGSKEVQVLFHRQVLIKGEAPRHIPYPPPDLLIIAYNIQSADRCRTAIRQQQGCQYPEQRRLARPVRPDQPEKLPFADMQRDVLQSLNLPIYLIYMSNINLSHHCLLNITSPYCPIFK